MTLPHPTTTARQAPLMAWVLVLLAVVSSTQLTGETPWATGVLDGGERLTVGQGDLIATTGYLGSSLLAFGGLGFAALLGLPAVPWSRAGRWVLTAVLVALTVAGVAVSLTEEDGIPTGEVVVGVVVTLVPVTILLALVWSRRRRGCATAALVAAAVALVAHLGTLVGLLASDGTPAWGAWAMLALLLVGLAGAALMVRTIPRRADALTP